MVKAVVGEETQLNLAEDRLFQSEVPAQVGLVVGKLSSGLDRGFVFDLILTPPNDSGAPACSVPESGKDDKKKGSKGKSQVEPSSLLIDIDWVAEHARQVSRMLLGGMNVVGIYVWATESLFKASNVIIWQTVKEVAEAAPFYESKVDERLLIHISYSPRRWICRNCTVGSSITSSSLRPCDFKMGRVVEDEPCTTDGSHDVELLLPFIKDAPIEASSQKEVAGIVIFTGSICSFAYLSPKEPISQAIADIKGDIIMSLQSRLDIICDEAEDVTHSAIDDSEEASNEISTERPIPQHILQLLRKPCKLSFPRRVLIPWVASAFICDYLQPSDTFEVLKEHCKELMSMEAPTDTSSILEPETEATSLTTKSFWDAVLTRYSTSGSDYDSVRKMESDSAGKEINRESFKLTNFNFVAALVIVLLSILVGLVLPIFKA
ncbi:PREDICTED: protein odr-4 homolog isoform X2 [Nelumbo nucifera]|uniref:Protein odr-4 homolog isoform X2 n=2 Tax=Nelumbo nucifera TaxID=4432 RepID=A0A1U7YW23_NELNU|nr:PREDICTED: protein odr-4 homolog isoform X2 [Nelumbo nucifera]DAD22210.1 TPA_asm: hypothetical protein HUJ06_023673 [Nelumbo nucifera]